VLESAEQRRPFAVDGQGNVFTVRGKLHTENPFERVKAVVLHRDGSVARTMGDYEFRYSYVPRSLAVTAQGHLFVINDYQDHGRRCKMEVCLCCCVSVGMLLVLCAQLLFAVQLFVGKYGDISFDQYGDTMLHSPQYVATDREGNALITESMPQCKTARVSVWERSEYSCKRIGCFAELGTKPGALLQPAQICADRRGRVYVVDAKTGRIHVWSY